MLASTCVMHPPVRRLLRTPLVELWPVRHVMAIGVAYAAGFGVAHALDRALDGHVGTVAALAGGTVAYVAGFLLAGGLGQRDRDRIRDVRERIASRRAATA
jgi:hypothetical protein